MSFFDKKEEVIDFTLTRKGKELFSRGKFKPAFYCFIDDEILYDKLNANSDIEGQSEIVERINDTILIKNQTGWEEVKKNTTLTPGFNVVDDTKRVRNPFVFQLGKSSSSKQFKPAWEINIEEGTIELPVSLVPLEKSATTSSYNEELIPQIDIKCEYNVKFVSGNEAAKISGNNNHNAAILLQKSSKDIILSIKEINSDNTSDNFSLEVYQYVYNNNEVSGNLKPISFSDAEYNDEVFQFFFNLLTDSNKDISIKFTEDSTSVSDEQNEC